MLRNKFRGTIPKNTRKCEMFWGMSSKFIALTLGTATIGSTLVPNARGYKTTAYADVGGKKSDAKKSTPSSVKTTQSTPRQQQSEIQQQYQKATKQGRNISANPNNKDQTNKSAQNSQKLENEESQPYKRCIETRLAYDEMFCTEDNVRKAFNIILNNQTSNDLQSKNAVKASAKELVDFYKGSIKLQTRALIIHLLSQNRSAGKISNEIIIDIFGQLRANSFDLFFGSLAELSNEGDTDLAIELLYLFKEQDQLSSNNNKSDSQMVLDNYILPYLKSNSQAAKRKCFIDILDKLKSEKESGAAILEDPKFRSVVKDFARRQSFFAKNLHLTQQKLSRQEENKNAFLQGFLAAKKVYKNEDKKTSAEQKFNEEFLFLEDEGLSKDDFFEEGFLFGIGKTTFNWTEKEEEVCGKELKKYRAEYEANCPISLQTQVEDFERILFVLRTIGMKKVFEKDNKDYGFFNLIRGFANFYKSLPEPKDAKAYKEAIFHFVSILEKISAQKMSNVISVDEFNIYIEKFLSLFAEYLNKYFKDNSLSLGADVITKVKNISDLIQGESNKLCLNKCLDSLANTYVEFLKNNSSVSLAGKMNALSTLDKVIPAEHLKQLKALVLENDKVLKGLTEKAQGGPFVINPTKLLEFLRSSDVEGEKSATTYDLLYTLNILPEFKNAFYKTFNKVMIDINSLGIKDVVKIINIYFLCQELSKDENNFIVFLEKIQENESLLLKFANEIREFAKGKQGRNGVWDKLPEFPLEDIVINNDTAKNCSKSKLCLLNFVTMIKSLSLGIKSGVKIKDENPSIFRFTFKPDEKNKNISTDMAKHWSGAFLAIDPSTERMPDGSPVTLQAFINDIWGGAKNKSIYEAILSSFERLIENLKDSEYYKKHVIVKLKSSSHNGDAYSFYLKTFKDFARDEKFGDEEYKDEEKKYTEFVESFLPLLCAARYAKIIQSENTMKAFNELCNNCLVQEHKAQQLDEFLKTAYPLESREVIRNKALDSKKDFMIAAGSNKDSNAVDEKIYFRVFKNLLRLMTLKQDSKGDWINEILKEENHPITVDITEDNLYKLFIKKDTNAADAKNRNAADIDKWVNQDNPVISPEKLREFDNDTKHIVKSADGKEYDKGAMFAPKADIIKTLYENFKGGSHFWVFINEGKSNNTDFYVKYVFYRLEQLMRELIDVSGSILKLKTRQISNQERLKSRMARKEEILLMLGNATGLLAQGLRHCSAGRSEAIYEIYKFLSKDDKNIKIADACIPLGFNALLEKSIPIPAGGENVMAIKGVKYFFNGRFGIKADKENAVQQAAPIFKALTSLQTRQLKQIEDGVLKRDIEKETVELRSGVLSGYGVPGREEDTKIQNLRYKGILGDIANLFFKSKFLAYHIVSTLEEKLLNEILTELFTQEGKTEKIKKELMKYDQSHAAIQAFKDPKNFFQSSFLYFIDRETKEDLVMLYLDTNGYLADESYVWPSFSLQLQQQQSLNEQQNQAAGQRPNQTAQRINRQGRQNQAAMQPSNTGWQQLNQSTARQPNQVRVAQQPPLNLPSNSRRVAAAGAPLLRQPSSRSSASGAASLQQQQPNQTTARQPNQVRVAQHPPLILPTNSRVAAGAPLLRQPSSRSSASGAASLQQQPNQTTARQPNQAGQPRNTGRQLLNQSTAHRSNQVRVTQQQTRPH